MSLQVFDCVDLCGEISDLCSCRSGSGNLDLQPSETNHRVPVSHFWQQTISAVGSCRSVYQVTNHTERHGLEFAASDDGVHFSVVSTEERRYTFEVKATDGCSSGMTSKNYSVVFVSGQSSADSPCAGTNISFICICSFFKFRFACGIVEKFAASTAERCQLY